MLYGEVKIALINTYLAISEEKVTLMLVELHNMHKIYMYLEASST